MPPATVTEFDLGYLIGLIVGEGSFTGDRKQPALSVKMHARDPEPLARLHELLGGRIYGPYLHDGRNYSIWLLRGADLAAAVPLFERHLPPCSRRRQFELWRHQHADFFSARSLSLQVRDEASSPGTQIQMEEP